MPSRAAKKAQKNCSDGSDPGRGEKGSRKRDGDRWRKGHGAVVRIPCSMLSQGCGGAGAGLGWESRDQLRPLLIAMAGPAQRELGAGTLQTLGLQTVWSIRTKHKVTRRVWEPDPFPRH